MRRKMKPWCKRILSAFFLSIICVLIAALIVLLFACFDSGKDWENVRSADFAAIFQNQCLRNSYLALIGFRSALYLLPAPLIAVVRWFYNKKKTEQGKGKLMLGLLADTYGIQFFAYSFVLAIYEVLGLDYLLGINILSKMDSFVFIVGLIGSLLIERKLPIKEIYEANDK